MSLRTFLLRSTLAALLVLATACSSGTDVATETAELPTTTVATGDVSTDPEPVDTVDPGTATTVVQPEATTTTTSTTTTEAPAPVDDGRTFDPVFDPILDELRETSGVPLRLPADLGLDPDADSDIAATLISSDADGYLVIVGFGDDCNGGNVCRIGSYTGSYAVLDPEQLETAVPVPLPNELSGHFFDATCGANCGDGIVEWAEDGVVYTVGQKVGLGAPMLRLAWQSIDADAAPPVEPEMCAPETIRDGPRAAALVSDEALDLHWVTACSADGIVSELATGPGTLHWFDLDGDGANDLALETDDGTWLFSVVGIQLAPIMDFDTFGRMRVDDLRCMDLDGDGTRELINAAEGTVYEFINPVTVATSETTVDGADTFDRCY